MHTNVRSDVQQGVLSSAHVPHSHTHIYTIMRTHISCGIHTPRLQLESEAIKSASMRALFSYTRAYKHIHTYIFILVYTHRYPARYTLLDYNLNPWLSKTRACVPYSHTHIHTNIYTYTYVYTRKHTDAQRRTHS